MATGQQLLSPTALGSDGLVVSGMGLGCMGLTEFYGEDSRGADPDRVIGGAIDLGIRLIDTADAYGPWRNEEAVGRALTGSRRDKVTLSTKFGVVRREDQREGISGAICGRPDYVREACEASLKRLRTERIDLFFMHRPDPDTPIEDTVGAMADLVRAGKVQHIGFCEIGETLLRRAHSGHAVTALQSEYSLWHRDPETLFPLLRELGIGFMPYSPLGRGFLTGRIRSIDDLAQDDWRRHSPRFQGENFERNLAVVDQVRAIADRKGCSLAQLALAWVRAAQLAVVPLSGATEIGQLEENAAALNIRLTRAELDAIEAVSPRGAFAGMSWPEGSVGAQVDTAQANR